MKLTQKQFRAIAREMVSLISAYGDELSDYYVRSLSKTLLLDYALDFRFADSRWYKEEFIILKSRTIDK